jgi:hypothetical protein
MLTDYLTAAMERALYELIENEELFERSSDRQGLLPTTSPAPAKHSC